MKQVSFWAVLILIAVGLQILGRMSSPAKPTKKTEPASVSKIEGTELKRLTLLPEAVRRLDIKTAVVREETLEPKQVVGGEVVSTSADGNSAILRVELTEIEAGKVRRDEPAYVAGGPQRRAGSPTRPKPDLTNSTNQGPAVVRRNREYTISRQQGAPHQGPSASKGGRVGSLRRARHDPL